MTEQEMVARIAELEKKLLNKGSSMRLKVSEKGGVSFYGVGRFPVTLYASQWQIIFDNVEVIKAFITENHALLSVKESEKAAAKATA